MGGSTYRGSAHPALYGWNISADVYGSRFFLTSASISGGWITSSQSPGIPAVADFAEDEAGEVYVVSMGGKIYRLGTSSVAGIEQLSKFKNHKVTISSDDGWLHLTFAPGIFRTIDIIGVNGEVKIRRAIKAENDEMRVHLPGVTGIHVLRFSGAEHFYTVKTVLH